MILNNDYSDKFTFPLWIPFFSFIRVEFDYFTYKVRLFFAGCYDLFSCFWTKVLLSVVYFGGHLLIHVLYQNRVLICQKCCYTGIL